MTRRRYDPDTRRKVGGTIYNDLILGMQRDSETLFAALTELLPMADSPKARELVKRAMEAHRRIDGGIIRLSNFRQGE